MLGAHSTSTGLYGLGSHLRRVIPNAVTMSQYFSKFGYRAESLGKVFHIGHGNLGDPQAFEVPHFHDKVIEYLVPNSTDGGKLTREEALFTNQKLAKYVRFRGELHLKLRLPRMRIMQMVALPRRRSTV